MNFITFWGEGFRGGKSDTLSKFNLKYPQKDLTEDEKIIIPNISENNEIKNIFGSLQLIIFYFANKNFKKDIEIKEILKDPPEYLKINESCSNFFNQEGHNFKVNQLMNIFFYFEHLCFDDLIKTLKSEYKAKISKEIDNKIKEQLVTNVEIIDKEFIKNLSAAVR